MATEVQRLSHNPIVTKKGASKQRTRFIKTIGSYLLLGGISLVLLTPLLWMIFTSLKPMTEIVQFPPTFFPKTIHWENYLMAINSFPFWSYAKNTLIIAGSVVIGNVLANSFIAYGFAKLNFPGKRILFALVLSTMMIPGFVTMIPQYVIFSKIGWVGTYLPLIVPSFFGNAFNIFLMRQFYLSISNELIEAAQLDGANHLYIWSHLMIPLTKPALITIAINSFNGAWNDFLGPLLYIKDQRQYTLQIGLQVFKNQSTTQWHYLMAGAVLVLLPTILLFFFAQRYFIEGMNLTAGTKG
ncbi:carbohydrate ABC transporter permease [Lapidilactobacillus mulanensis]|uniref:Carbohydrate ABC transporter permease n=1 Tax=Lapidilactobacillus mulanensis TaxID=2485999 RepID=A0ABW4DN91_9LACO|nr:carbohydrate ABC transporter permease [Lapidilactobacillus mulanensis]